MLQNGQKERTHKAKVDYHSGRLDLPYTLPPLSHLSVSFALELCRPFCPFAPLPVFFVNPIFAAMQILTIFSMLTVAVMAAPMIKREPSVSCGGRTFSGSQVATAVNNADNDAAASTTYPHTYKYVQRIANLFPSRDTCCLGRYDPTPVTLTTTPSLAHSSQQLRGLRLQ